MKKSHYHPKQPFDKYPYDRKFSKPTEVFCSDQFHGYYVRGQILSFPYAADGPSEKYSEFYYQFYLLALVNPAFLMRAINSLIW